jgi:glycosyltransferase involved in cell wall biosynthesis
MKIENIGGKKGVKLSIITQFYPPDYAATGQLIEELAKKLSELGLDVKVFTGQPGYAFQKKSAPAVEILERLKIKRSRVARMWHQRIRGKAASGFLFCLRAGIHLLKKSNRGDVLLVTTAPPFLPVIGLLANLFFKLPYVCLLYDIYPDIAVELNVVSPHHWVVKLWNFINKLSWKRAKNIIVLSSTMKERIVAKCPEIANKIDVIHNWADPNLIVPIAKEDNWFARQLDSIERFTVLYSGNLGRCHDLETVMEAAKILQKEPIEFVFVGNGAKSKICQSKVQEWELQNCRFLPYQDKENLPYSLTAGDLSLVSISAGIEGLVAPSKLYGALAAGRPIAAICEPHSYLCELLDDAKCGTTVDNGDAQSLAEFIRQLAKDRDLCDRMGKAGRSYLMSHFTLEIIAREYASLLIRSVAKDIDLEVAQLPSESLTLPR